jgi:hypothetical protein
VVVVGLSDAVSVATGYFHSCAARRSGEVVCWGNNDWGELGDGTFSSSLVPVAVTGLSDAVSVIAGGSDYSCALRRTGEVACWGDNFSGQLGNGSTDKSPEPVAVLGLSDVVSLAGGSDFVCAVRKTGEVACWGDIGVGAPDDYRLVVPTTVPGVSDAVSVAAGYWHACAVRAGGAVVCWGYEGYGQLGNGISSDSSLVPIDVPGLSDAASVSAGTYHTCAARTNGEVVCWGTGDHGQLGDGVSSYSAAPVTVQRLSDAISVVAGEYHSCALGPSGDVVCWGDHSDGQLGNGPLQSNVPEHVLGVAGTGIGRPCAGPTDCGNGFCVDGVCCESACGNGDPTDCLVCGPDGVCTTASPAIRCHVKNPSDFCDADRRCSGTSDACPAAPAANLCAAATDDPALCIDPTYPACTPLGGWESGAVGSVFLEFDPAWDGHVKVTETSQGCAPPTGFQILGTSPTPGSGQFWNLEAEAGYPTPVKICIKYDPTLLADQSMESFLQLYHGTTAPSCTPDTGQLDPGWHQLTGKTVDTTNHVICAQTPSLSPFAIAEPIPGARPVVVVPGDLTAAATTTAGASVSFAATATDFQGTALVPTCVPASGSVFPVGTTTVTCTATDFRSVPGSASFKVRVVYDAPADGTFFGTPINSDGSSIFKLGSTIPVKFHLTGASAGITNLVAHLYMAKVSNGILGTFVEAITNVAADAGNTFRYDGSQYVYNLSTKPLSTGTWSIKVDLGDHVDHTVDVSLK